MSCNFEDALIRPLCLLKNEVYKLVFIDACRGNRNLKGDGSQGEGYNLDNIMLPARAIIAYSTMPHHEAYDIPGRGSPWMQRLALQLEISNKSIVDVVMKANLSLNLQREQQRPEYKTSNCDIRLKGGYYKISQLVYVAVIHQLSLLGRHC